MLDLEPIKARLDAIKSMEPWVWRNRSSDGADDPFLGHDIEGLESSYLDRGMLAYRNDAEFIAHSREDVAALIAEVERLRALGVDYI